MTSIKAFSVYQCHHVGLQDVKAWPGGIKCTMPVLQKVQNRYGTLHGGCVGELLPATICQDGCLLQKMLPHKPSAWRAATLVDTVGSAALVTKVENAGVSLHISVDYLSRSATAWHDACCQTASAFGASWSAELAPFHGCSMPGDET